MKYWIDLDIDDLLATKISNPWIAILMLLYISSNLWLSLLIIEWSCKMLLSFFKSIYNSCSDLVDKAYFYGGMIFGQTKAEEEKREEETEEEEKPVDQVEVDPVVLEDQVHLEEEVVQAVAVEAGLRVDTRLLKVHNITDRLREYLVSGATSAATYMIHTFQIGEDSPMRFCTDSVDRDVRLEDGTTATFETRNATFAFGAASAYITSNMNVTVDNADLALTNLFRTLATADEPTYLIYRLYLANRLDQPAADMIRLPITDPTIEESRVTFNATQVYVLNTPFPNRDFSEDLFPNLMRGRQ